MEASRDGPNLPRTGAAPEGSSAHASLSRIPQFLPNHVLEREQPHSTSDPLRSPNGSDGKRSPVFGPVDDLDLIHGAVQHHRVLAKHDRVDGIVFNAVSRPMAGLHDPVETWESSMATNATGFLLTALFKPRLVVTFVVTVIGTAIAAGYLIPLIA